MEEIIQDLKKLNKDIEKFIAEIYLRNQDKDMTENFEAYLEGEKNALNFAKDCLNTLINYYEKR